VKNQTYDLCLEAVKRDGWSLQYVENQTEKLCLEAVRQSAWSLCFAKYQTYEICLLAVNKRTDTFDDIRDPTIKQRVADKLDIKV
jgi:hypothetical protein